MLARIQNVRDALNCVFSTHLKLAHMMGNTGMAWMISPIMTRKIVMNVHRESVLTNAKRQWIWKGGKGQVYQASVADCRICLDFSRCIWTKKEQGDIKRGRRLVRSKSNEPGSLTRRMHEKLATKEYQELYAYRLQIIEPVFANISYSKGLNRFTLRSKRKVNGQWQLYCMVHNLGKCLNWHTVEKKRA